jgi:hypothetical protein
VVVGGVLGEEKVEGGRERRVGLLEKRGIVWDGKITVELLV